MHGSSIVKTFWKLPAACCGESSILKRNNYHRFGSLIPRQAAGNVLAGGFSRWLSLLAGRLLPAMSALIMIPAVSGAAEKVVEKAAKIAVLPEAPYYLYIAYECLAVFWVGILGLLVIIRMKLREIERIQALGVEQEDPDAPLLQ
jgi:hypothetical protein